jgi:hypothetical protein
MISDRDIGEGNLRIKQIVGIKVNSYTASEG